MTSSGSPLIRLMVVEDHPIVREGLVLILGTQADMEVVADCGDGRSAVEMHRQRRPDVTLMDLRMPGMGGVEAIQAIRAEEPGARFIVLTTYDGDEDIFRALSAGAQAYLLKGMSHGDLVEAIRAVHAGMRRIPPAVAQRLEERAAGDELSPRELDVLRLIVQGATNREIGTTLALTEGTVKQYVNHILAKLGVRDRTAAATTAIQRGIVHLD